MDTFNVRYYVSLDRTLKNVPIFLFVFFSVGEMYACVTKCSAQDVFCLCGVWLIMGIDVHLQWASIGWVTGLVSISGGYMRIEHYKFILIFNSNDCQNNVYWGCCLYAALDYVIDARESLSHGNLGACWQLCHELGRQRVEWHNVKGQC